MEQESTRVQEGEGAGGEEESETVVLITEERKMEQVSTRVQEGERAGGEEESEKVVCWIKLGPSTVMFSAVNWTQVDRLITPYNIAEVIKHQRLPTIFPNPTNPTAFAGGLLVYVPDTQGETRRVYFEGSNPATPLMRVAQNSGDDDTVRTSYSWDRVNFVYNEMGSGSYMFYLYTPANLNSFGLVVEGDGEVYFKPTPDRRSQDNLTLFQIESQDQHTANIRVVNTDFVLYIEADGTMKAATPNRQQWNRFRITGFTPQQNATAGMSSMEEDAAPQNEP